MTFKGEGSDLDGSGAVPLGEEDPQRIGSIRLVGKLGAGGMGRVYLGVASGRYAAVKQVLPLLAEDEGFLRHFGHELDNLARLPAEATAPLLASDRSARPPWFATAYIPGLTLSEAVDLHGGRLPADALWLLLREAAAGLKTVHAQDMVHRDLKPSNVMVTVDGLTLIDFGVARAVDQSRLTQTGMIVGTPAYMSPEQASGKRQLSGATDVFALGSLIAFAASGNPPFGDGAGLGTLYRIVHDEPDLQPVRDLDPELARIVASCLDKDPEGRPTSAELHELAVGRGASVAGAWPSAVAERLSERAAFATTVPRIEDDEAQAEDVRTTDLAAPDRPARTLPAAPPEPVGESADATPVVSTEPRPTRERRRKRLLLAILPVLVVGGGTTLALQLLPYTSPLHDNGRAAPSASVSTQLHPTAPSSGAGHSGAPSGRATPGQQPQPASSGDATGGSGTGDDKGTSSGSRKETGGGDGAGGSGGSGANGSGGSGGTATKKPPESPTPGGYHRIKNAGNAQCLIETVYGNAPAFGDCTGDPSGAWTYHQASDGTFTVVNQRTGDCLTAGMPGNNALAVGCGGTGQSWRAGTGGTLHSVYNGQCLDIAYGGGVATAACEPGKTSQRWTAS
ncbi:protein kinase domain-containing protein [Streptomyces sp. RGM 3693]|uniref:serine/threonine-protein kinase n=1 Tax=Streptomyces sp. RGM 3693 TaxID=3413284 RepID=UPI003D28F59A